MFEKLLKLIAAWDSSFENKENIIEGVEGSRTEQLLRISDREPLKYQKYLEANEKCNELEQEVNEERTNLYKLGISYRLQPSRYGH